MSCTTPGHVCLGECHRNPCFKEKIHILAVVLDLTFKKGKVRGNLALNPKQLAIVVPVSKLYLFDPIYHTIQTHSTLKF